MLFANAPLFPNQFAQNWKDIIELLILAVAGAAAIRQLYLLRGTLVFQQEQQREEHAQARIGRAIDLDRRLEQCSEERTAVDRAFPNVYKAAPIPKDQIYAAFQADPKLENSVYLLLDFFETHALTVLAGATDENMAFDLNAGALISFAQRFKFFIEDRRIVENRPAMYVYLLTLAEIWQERKDREQNLPPFFLRKK